MDFDMDTIAILFGVMFGLLLLSWIFYAVAKNYREKEDDAQPLLKTYAKVIEKQSLNANSLVTSSASMIVFETETGERVRLCVDKMELVLGDSGMLTWQGKRFVAFERQ